MSKVSPTRARFVMRRCLVALMLDDSVRATAGNAVWQPSASPSPQPPASLSPQPSASPSPRVLSEPAVRSEHARSMLASGAMLGISRRKKEEEDERIFANETEEEKTIRHHADDQETLQMFCIVALILCAMCYLGNFCFLQDYLSDVQAGVKTAASRRLGKEFWRRGEAAIPNKRGEAGKGTLI